jgi:LacI family transcriptional regulator
LALLANVTQATVSLALRDDPHISTTKRRQIQNLARRHGYKSDPALAQIMARTRRHGFERSALALFIGTNPTDFQTVEPHHELAYGVESRGDELGYDVTRFWLDDADLTPRRQAAILHARGIEGAVILWGERTAIPKRFAPLYENFACAVVGTRPVSPPIHVAMADHFRLGSLAFEKALALGCERPAALIYPGHDATTDFRLSLGCIAAQQMLALRKPIPPLVQNLRDPEVLAWLDRHQPDFLLFTEEPTIEHLVQFPRFRKIRFFPWDLPRRPKPGAVGIQQNARTIGSAGVDLVIGQLQRNERGLPTVQKCLLIESTPV